MSLPKHFFARLRERGSVVLIAAVLICGFVSLWLPDVLAHAVYQGEDNDRYNRLVDDYRRSLLVTIAGAVIVYALSLARKQSKMTEQRLAIQQKNFDLARQGQMTDRLMKAISQLSATDAGGRKQTEIRLGGIYVLERISRESPDDYWSIVEILSAYVRQSGTTNSAPYAHAKVDPDVQAALAVLGRRQYKSDAGPLDLSGATLPRAEMRAAHFEEINLVGACLHSAGLQEAHLEGAVLVNADLQASQLTEAFLEGAHMAAANLNSVTAHRARFQRADLTDAWLQRGLLTGTHLEKADLTRARLEGAKLSGAHLEQATLTEACLESADLTRAYLQGANLAGVINVTQDQIDSAYGDGTTQLPPGITCPPHWSTSWANVSSGNSSRLISSR
jgi:uncharacterized protein YjbI with pentapeptide repeats